MPACVDAQHKQCAAQWQMQIARSALPDAQRIAQRSLATPRGPWPEGALQFCGHLNKTLPFLEQFLLLQERQALALT